ncbi:hypothetical protein VPH35_024036 [Triticum aestivum]
MNSCCTLSCTFLLLLADPCCSSPGKILQATAAAHKQRLKQPPQRQHKQQREQCTRWPAAKPGPESRNPRGREGGGERERATPSWAGSGRRRGGPPSASRRRRREAPTATRRRCRLREFLRARGKGTTRDRDLPVRGQSREKDMLDICCRIHLTEGKIAKFNVKDGNGSITI